MLALLLAATVTWTMPTQTASEDSCSGGPPVRELSGWRLYAQVQSPTWVAEHVHLEGSSSVWGLRFPVVREEALPRQVRSASTENLPNGGAGQRVTVSGVPDSLDGQPVLGYFVVTFNRSLKSSCQGNFATRGW